MPTQFATRKWGLWVQGSILSYRSLITGLKVNLSLRRKGRFRIKYCMLFVWVFMWFTVQSRVYCTWECLIFQKIATEFPNYRNRLFCVFSSCLPNAVLHFDGSRAGVRAIDDINEGTEVEFYVPVCVWVLTCTNSCRLNLCHAMTVCWCDVCDIELFVTFAKSSGLCDFFSR